MISYYHSGCYDFNAKLDNAIDEIFAEIDSNINDFEFEFDLKVDTDMKVLYNLVIYNNHPAITSITQEYLNKNKFRNEDKIKMLKAMNESYVGIFKLTSIDSENGYIEIEDIITKKKFKIIDISQSILNSIKSSKNIYSYNRIITYEDISFSTALYFPFKSDNKELNDYLKKHKNKPYTEFIRTLDLYEIYKKTGLTVKSHNI